MCWISVYRNHLSDSFIEKEPQLNCQIITVFIICDRKDGIINIALHGLIVFFWNSQCIIYAQRCRLSVLQELFLVKSCKWRRIVKCLMSASFLLNYKALLACLSSSLQTQQMDMFVQWRSFDTSGGADCSLSCALHSNPEGLSLIWSFRSRPVDELILQSERVSDLGSFKSSTTTLKRRYWYYFAACTVPM